MHTYPSVAWVSALFSSDWPDQLDKLLVRFEAVPGRNLPLVTTLIDKIELLDENAAQPV